MDTAMNDDLNRDSKRPRVEAFAKASASDAAAYRAKHEITVMVSQLWSLLLGLCFKCMFISSDNGILGESMLGVYWLTW